MAQTISIARLFCTNMPNQNLSSSSQRQGAGSELGGLFEVEHKVRIFSLGELARKADGGASWKLPACTYAQVTRRGAGEKWRRVLVARGTWLIEIEIDRRLVEGVVPILVLRKYSDGPL